MPDTKPWEHEPDSMEWVDAATGLECRIVRGPVGALCGYVGVPIDHPAYGLGYDPDPDLHWPVYGLGEAIHTIQVHGGLTYADKWCPKAEGKGAVLTDLWWFGFDCAHAGDHCPHIDEHPSIVSRFINTYRDIDYVKEQCRLLALQLREIEELAYEP